MDNEENRSPQPLTPQAFRYQVAGYARDILSYGVIRSHVITLMIDDAKVIFVYYDHSLIVESEVLDLQDSEQKLLFVKMIKQMHALSPEALGIIPNLQAPFMYDPKQLKNPGLYLEPAAKEGTIPSHKVLVGCLLTVDYNTKTRQGQRTVRLGKVLFCSNGINGRGTKVIRVTCSCKDGDCAWKGKDGECDWKGLKLRCTDMAVDEHAWVLKHLPNVLGWFITDGGALQVRLKLMFGADYDERLICGSIQEELCPIMDLESQEQFAQVMYDVLQCHEWVYTHPRVLHRDISQANIMFRRDATKKIYGVLNDYDLAALVDERHAPTSGHRTGTKPYMAHEQQRTGWTGPLFYRHDLESLFYVILLLVYHYQRPGVKAEKLEFVKWFTEGDDFIYKEKSNLLRVVDFSWIAAPQPFFGAFRYWLQTIRDSLVDGFSDQGLALRKARVGGQISFDLETLGDNFSYKTMSAVMRNFDGKELVTRNPK
ncbi:hypothetical protein BT96DRAFT_924607 [Gymnopus androsaceus JB14]|uniref:Protein kinase domain-containing protein n=1 Tax=Gymnopus androsaceus JB14 TaxID=1447944 RepID=A0A6A4H4N1_9AGAR|nr:hypothetical protein BT96DRAFT_924607 [Gymnopus androsaceus JB14]